MRYLDGLWRRGRRGNTLTQTRILSFSTDKNNERKKKTSYRVSLSLKKLRINKWNCFCWLQMIEIDESLEVETGFEDWEDPIAAQVIRTHPVGAGRIIRLFSSVVDRLIYHDGLRMMIQDDIVDEWLLLLLLLVLLVLVSGVFKFGPVGVVDLVVNGQIQRWRQQIRTGTFVAVLCGAAEEFLGVQRRRRHRRRTEFQRKRHRTAAELLLLLLLVLLEWCCRYLSWCLLMGRIEVEVALAETGGPVAVEQVRRVELFHQRKNGRRRRHFVDDGQTGLFQLPVAVLLLLARRLLFPPTPTISSFKFNFYLFFLILFI